MDEKYRLVLNGIKLVVDAHLEAATDEPAFITKTADLIEEGAALLRHRLRELTPCPLCNGTGIMKARQNLEAQNGINDTYDGDLCPCPCKREEKSC